MATRRTLVAFLGVALGGALLAACSSTPTSASAPRDTVTDTSTSTTTAPATSTTSPVVTSTSTTTTTLAPTTPSTCQNTELQVTQVSGGGAAAGTIELPFTIANTGASTCVLDGYPGITLVPKTGKVTPTITHSGQGQVFQGGPSAITLPAGGSPAAAFVISYSDVQTNGEASCPEITDIKAALPGPAGTFQFAQTFYPCGGPTIGVSPLVSYSTYKAQFSG